LVTRIRIIVPSWGRHPSSIRFAATFSRKGRRKTAAPLFPSRLAGEGGREADG
jgi:hypothetical protein